VTFFLGHLEAKVYQTSIHIHTKNTEKSFMLMSPAYPKTSVRNINLLGAGTTSKSTSNIFRISNIRKQISLYSAAYSHR
jgi:hypothetical protein